VVYLSNVCRAELIAKDYVFFSNSESVHVSTFPYPSDNMKNSLVPL